jgi:hypothetical protein
MSNIIRDLVRPAGFSPATWAELGPAQKNKNKNKNSSKIISKKYVILL